MRVADYVFDFFAKRGIRHVFFVSGGGAMHLNDALGRQQSLKYVCNLHEQACAIAAEGYARVTNLPGVVCVTTGPGGTNALTGVLGAWLDSIPMIVISGQVKRSTMISSVPNLRLRQLGDQEADIVSVVRPITKSATVLMDPVSVRFELEKAWELARSGRPGPVWLDIPLDVQAAEIANVDELRPYLSSTKPLAADPSIPEEVYARLAKAERPVILAGNGVRLSGCVQEFREFAERLNIPVLTAISGVDLLPSTHPLFFGRPGLLGERAANFILQNADLLLVLGTRMNLRLLSYAYDGFAREAFKIMVDVDEAEFYKPTLKIDLPVVSDAGAFIGMLKDFSPLAPKSAWLSYCTDKRTRYPIVTDEHRSVKEYVSSYMLAEQVSNRLSGTEIIVTGNGIAYTSTFQAIRLCEGNRMFGNVGCASMGYDLPAAIGAAFAGSGRKVICFTGDGSIQMNLQEIQTILNYRLPIKIILLNNDGYLSIKHTQKGFFDGRFVGSHPPSGVILPDMAKICSAYGLRYGSAKNNEQLGKALSELMAGDEPALCEVFCDPFEVVGPKSATRKLADGTLVSSPLEDLYPFLPREEFYANMIVKPIS